jgi:cytochrome bd-type quinol oxidase subunit 2
MDRHPNIMNAASNLLGICFLLITGLSVTRSNGRSFADEVAWVAALCFLISLFLAYVAIRRQDEHAWQSVWADRIFMLGVLALLLATVVVGFAFR